MNINIKNKHVGVNNISTLINQLSFFFRFQGKNIENYNFEITPDELDPVSALVIFKVFEYNLKFSCLAHPYANLSHILKLMAKYKLEKLFKKLISDKDVENLYKRLEPFKTDGFFIAPHPINRNNFKSKDELEKKYTEFISNYYKNICPDLVQYFNTCICEIASNFLYHALEDDNSILMAQGNKNYIEIVCVDNSNGIITSLNPNSENHETTMKNAFKRGLSSKKENGHCGTGLWYVQEITKLLNGTFRVYSEDISYICKSKKIFVRKSAYWQGSIFYLKLRTDSNSNVINDFFNKITEENNLGLISSN